MPNSYTRIWPAFTMVIYLVNQEMFLPLGLELCIAADEDRIHWALFNARTMELKLLS